MICYFLSDEVETLWKFLTNSLVSCVLFFNCLQLRRVPESQEDISCCPLLRTCSLSSSNYFHRVDLAFLRNSFSGHARCPHRVIRWATTTSRSAYGCKHNLTACLVLLYPSHARSSNGIRHTLFGWSSSRPNRFESLLVSNQTLVWCYLLSVASHSVRAWLLVLMQAL